MCGQALKVRRNCNRECQLWHQSKILHHFRSDMNQSWLEIKVTLSHRRSLFVFVFVGNSPNLAPRITPEDPSRDIPTGTNLELTCTGNRHVVWMLPHEEQIVCLMLFLYCFSIHKYLFLEDQIKQNSDFFRVPTLGSFIFSGFFVLFHFEEKKFGPCLSKIHWLKIKCVETTKFKKPTIIK